MVKGKIQKTYTHNLLHYFPIFILCEAAAAMLREEIVRLVSIIGNIVVIRHFFKLRKYILRTDQTIHII